MPRPREKCHIEGCDGWCVGHGLCQLHYHRWWRWGDPYHITKNMAAPCVLDGCSGPQKALGLCQMHYRRWQRHGDPLWEVPLGKWERRSPEYRFWAKVEKTDTCWLWQGGKDGSGYGLFKFEGTQRRAHRVSYLWANGSIPDGLEIHHHCRVRVCVRPDHLEAVTRIENVMFQARAHPSHCKWGHPLSGENLYVLPSGQRQCRECGRRRARELRERKVAARNE
jgi:hypothetical protein